VKPVPGTPPIFLRGGEMSKARDLVFFYNGVEATDETIANVPYTWPAAFRDARRGGCVTSMSTQAEHLLFKAASTVLA
jgi:hypothetical protein